MSTATVVDLFSIKSAMANFSNLQFSFCILSTVLFYSASVQDLLILTICNNVQLITSNGSFLFFLFLDFFECVRVCSHIQFSN